ncbi:MAG: signal peptide peptidase SppA [Candidatus Margulisiibacteriota bacterium]
MRFRCSLHALMGLALLSQASYATDLYTTVKGGIGIQNMSMGVTGVSYALDGSALYYNPAGLSTPGGSARYEMLDLNSALYPQYGATLLYFSPFGIAQWNRRFASGSSFQVTGFGFGRPGNSGVSWGVNVKQITGTESGSAVTGWSSDLGLVTRFTRNLQVGILAQDIFKDIQALPSTFRAGFTVFNDPRTMAFTTEWEFAKNPDARIITHYGAEYEVGDGLTLRGGYFDQNITGGAKVALGFFDVEYGVISDTRTGGQTVYMLGFKVGKGPARSHYGQYAIHRDKGYASFDVGSGLVEGKSEISLLGGVKVGSNDLLTAIHTVNKDPSVQGYVVRIGRLGGSMATIALVQELRQELEKARNNGKKVIAYLEDWASLPEYYLASAADTIVMPSLGTLSHMGLELEIQKSQRFLEKFGIQSLVIASGRYKGSLSPESGPMTAEAKQLYRDLIQNLYQQVVTDVQTKRKLNWETIATVFDGRLITATEAKEWGLVDKLGYWDTVTDLIKEKDQEKAPLQDLAERLPPPPDTFLIAPPQIAVIEIDGAISQGSSLSDVLTGGKNTGASDIAQVVEDIKDNTAVRGVIVRVNSPGGTLLGSDEIYQSLQKLKAAGKPVYTSMGNVAASGGYYVGMGSDKIFANAGTLTGSIGVIQTLYSKDSLNQILGIEYDRIQTGPYMGLFSPNKPITADETKMIEKAQHNSYETFVQKVMESRKLTRTEADHVAQGQVFTGQQAVDLKLVDKVGNFYDAVDDMARKINLTMDPQVVFYRPAPKYTFNPPASGGWDYIFRFLPFLKPD